MQQLTLLNIFSVWTVHPGRVLLYMNLSDVTGNVLKGTTLCLNRGGKRFRANKLKKIKKYSCNFFCFYILLSKFVAHYG